MQTDTTTTPGPASLPNIGVLLLLITLSLFGLTTTLPLAAAPGIAADLAFTQIVTVGQNGFTEANGPQGIADRVVFGGTRNGRRTLYLYDKGVFIEVLPPDGTLPGGLGTIDAVPPLNRMLPNGDILFRANVSGGSLPAGQYTFRWRNGAITVQPEAGTNLNYITSDGRWLVEEDSGQSPTNTLTYFLTDGTTKEPLISLTHLDTECHITRFKVHAANASGVVAYTEIKIQKSVCAIGSPTFLTEWSLRLGGTVSQTLLSGSFTTRFGSSIRSGVGVNMLDSILNDNSELLMILETYDGVTGTTLRQNVVLGSSGGVQKVLFDTSDPPVFARLPPYFDDQGRIAVVGSMGGVSGPRTLLRGDTDNPAQDVVVQEGAPLFGSTLSLLQPTFSGYQNLAVPGENRGFYFTYDLADGTKGIGLASKDILNWANPDGGSWNTAANWTLPVVPGAGDRVRFGLDAAYPVDLGAAAAAGVNVEAGAVTWRSSELTIGEDGLGVFHADAGGTARLTIATADPAGERTTVSTRGVTVGFVPGAGELTLDGASLVPPEGAESGLALMGFGAPATALVTNGALWTWTEMSVGMNARSLLTVEDGSTVGFGAERLFVGGSPLGFPLSGAEGAVVVTNETNGPGPLSLGTLLGPVNEIVVGEALIGRLEVRDGAQLVGIRMDVGTRDHGATTDGFLVVAGFNDTEQARVALGQNENGGLFAATGAGTEAQVTVSDGGRMSLTRLSLADGAGSRAVMTVTGAAATPDGETLRSEVVAPIPPEEPGAPPPASPDHGRCVVGKTGFGSLTVASGGLVSCRELAVGLSAGSRGSLRIDGAFGGTASRVVAGGSQAGDGDVFVGRSPLFDGPPGSGVRSDVFIGADGVLEARSVAVSAGGRISGNGVVVVDTPLAVVDGGVVAPGIDVIEADPASSGPVLRALAPTPTGTLSVQGGVTFGPGSQLVLEVGGTAPGAYDALVVTGTATLGGQLTLVFVDGFLPRRGDTFRLLQAGSVLGAFAAVVATGLPEGFEYQVSVLGGEVRLTITCVPITLSPAALPGGTAGTPYSQALAASGGVEPYGFAVTAGALPGGLTLTPAGVLEGTPTQGGSFSFTVSATDPGPCAASRSYTLTIAGDGAVIASVVPSAGPTTGGQPVSISGSGLAGATGVTFGGVAGAITSSTDTLVTVTTPPHAPGVVDVVVTTPGGAVTATAAYTYVSATDAVAIPTASTLALILFAAALGGAALLRLR